MGAGRRHARKGVGRVSRVELTVENLPVYLLSRARKESSHGREPTSSCDFARAFNCITWNSIHNQNNQKSQVRHFITLNRVCFWRKAQKQKQKQKQKQEQNHKLSTFQKSAFSEVGKRAVHRRPDIC
jgi:hypothetical protein